MQRFIESLEGRQLLATLSSDDVTLILARAASESVRPGLEQVVVAVVDREANVLGVFGRSGLVAGRERDEIVLSAIARARTAALFQSEQNAFSTRTARFIIQDHFPQPVKNTPGGPLYGVQFSNLIGSDVVRNTPGISGDPGGIPLYKQGDPVGGIGVAGDFSDVAPRENLSRILQAYKPNPTGRVFDGKEETDVDEQLALAGAEGYAAPDSITADKILIDGLRFPYTKDAPADGLKYRRLRDLIAGGFGSLLAAPNLGKPTPAIISTPAVPFPTATFAGVTGQLKRQDTRLPASSQNFGIVSSNDTNSGGNLLPEAQRLTTPDVRRVIERAVGQASQTRAGIRLPVGTNAVVHVTVVDRDGDLLAAFRMGDGTNFSFDVAVQKARTAAFFSDDSHAFSTRAIGFLSQNFFPIGIEGGGGGPLYEIQNNLSPGLTLRSASSAINPLRNGITIFPGGVPLYKNGDLVGAIGVSGDGVDNDDLIAFAGAGKFQAPAGIRSDRLSEESIRTHILRKTRTLFTLFGTTPIGKTVPQLGPITIDRVADLLTDLDFRLPFVKFPRNPSTGF